MIGLGSASTLGIGLSIFLDDKFSEGSRRIGKELGRMKMNFNDFQDGLQNVDQFGQTLTSIGDRAIGVIKRSTMEYARFDKTMTATGSIAGLVGKKGELYKQLEAQTISFAGKYGQLPEDIAEANLELAKAGKSVPEILKLSNAMITLGAATDTRVSGKNGTAEMLVNIMQSYNAGTDQASKFANVLTSAANRSTIDVVDFYESLKYSSDVANSLHIPIEQVAASIATLGNAGLKGSMAGTAYANMLRYISTGVTEFGTNRQQQALAMMGLTGEDFKDAEGNLKNFGSILEMLRAKTAGMADPDRLGVLTALTGVRGNRALDILMRGMTTDAEGNKIQTYDEMYAGIQADDKGNIAQKTADERMNNLMGDLEKLKSAWSVFYLTTGKALAPVISLVAGVVTKLLLFFSELGSSPMGQWLIRVVLILGATLSPLGRLMSMGARFVGFMTTSSSIFKNGMNTGLIIAREIRAQLMAGATGFSTAIMRARGMSVMPMAGKAGGMIRGANGMPMAGKAGGMIRGANGRFLGKSSWLARAGGAIAGTKGAQWGIQLTRWFGAIGKMVPWLSTLGTWLFKGGGILKVFGGILGKAVGFLFGWPVLIADLASTFITGKSIFEWLWELIKWVGEGLSNLNPSNWISSIGNMFSGDIGTVSSSTVNPSAILYPGKQTYSKVMNSNTTNSPINLKVTVNPSTGDKKTEQMFNLNSARDLSGQGIKIYG